MKKQKTTDKSKKATDVEARIRAVATEMSAITEFAEGSIARVRELLESGKRYRKLEAEYSRLVTEAAISGLKKTQDS